MLFFWWLNLWDFLYIQIFKSYYCLFSDGPHALAVRSNGHVVTNGGNIFVGERMTVTADSNPGKRNYTWENTISNETIATGDSIVVTETMLGHQSLKAVVCNNIPLPSPHTVCNDFPLNVVVISKCVSITFTLDGVLDESGCFERCKTFNVDRFQSLLIQP